MRRRGSRFAPAQAATVATTGLLAAIAAGLFAIHPAAAAAWIASTALMTWVQDKGVHDRGPKRPGTHA